jgi:Phage tail protein
MKTIYLGSLQVHSNSDNTIGYVVYNHSGFDSPDVRLSQYNRPGEHGAVVTNQLYGGRTITLEGRIAAASTALYQQRRRDLQNALRIIKDANAVSQPILLKFQTLDDLLLQTYIYAATKLEFKERTPVFSEYYLELFASDYNFYDQSAQTSTLTPPSGGGVTYPIIYPVTYGASTGGSVTVSNAGTSNTFPNVTFNGPLTSPYINNTTTGETFQINRTLVSGESIVVDMQNKTMVLNGSTNALQYFVSTNTWLSLIPGDNLVNLGSSLSSDTGNVSISFRSAYIGV